MAVLTRKMKRNAFFMELYNKRLAENPGQNAKQLVKDTIKEWDILYIANQGKKGYKPIV